MAGEHDAEISGALGQVAPEEAGAGVAVEHRVDAQEVIAGRHAYMALAPGQESP